MAQKEVYFTQEELHSGNIEAVQAIEPMLEMINLENAEAYEQSMQPYTRPQRLIFAVEVYMAEVYNGGHEQFFFNSSGVAWQDALEIAKAEYEKIDPLLRGRWTTNEQLEHVDLVSGWEAFARDKAYLAKIGAEEATEKSGIPDGISMDVIALNPNRQYSVTVECTIQQSAFPTVPTLSLPEGADGSIMLDMQRYAGIPGLEARKSTKLSARLNQKTPGYFLVESAAGELRISFQGWVPSAGGQGEWKESTALPALVMKRDQLAPNKIRYGCTAAMEPHFNCFVFTVEWKEYHS